MTSATPSRREILVWGAAGLAQLVLAPGRGEAAPTEFLAPCWVGPEGKLVAASSVEADPSLAKSGIRLTIRGLIDESTLLRFLDVRVALPSDPPLEFHAWSFDARNTENVRTSGPVGLFVPLAKSGALRLVGEAQYVLPGRLGSVVGDGGKPSMVRRPFTLDLSLGGGRGPRLRTGTYLVGVPARGTGGAPSWKGFRFGELAREGGGVMHAATRSRAGGSPEAPRFSYLVLTAERAGAAPATS